MANNSTVRKGQCFNFGNCGKADTKEIIEVNFGDEFSCPECQGSLIELAKKSFPKWILFVAVGLIVLGGGGFGLYRFGLDKIPCAIPVVRDWCDCGGVPEPQDRVVGSLTPDGITLDITELSFERIGETAELSATILPDGLEAKNKRIVWKSGDESVVSVDANGTVTAVANGTTVVSAYTLNGLPATCYVKVGNGGVSDQQDVVTITPDGITLDKTKLSLKKIGETAKLSATIHGSEAKNQRILWKSSNESVVSVNASGMVTAVANGTAVVSASLNELRATCDVTVSKSEDFPVPGGTYTGELRNRKPHGMGTVHYDSRTLICCSDPKQRYAEAGQYIVGQFRDGCLLQGKLFDGNGNHLITIICGGGAH